MRRTSQCAQFGNYARAIRRAQFVTAAARSQARLRDRAVVEAELHATLIRHTEQLTAAEDRANQIERSTEDWSVERRQLQRTCKALQAAQNATRNDVATARINERRRCLKQLAQWGGYRESAGPRRGGPTASTLLDEVAAERGAAPRQPEPPPAAARRRGGDGRRRRGPRARRRLPGPRRRALAPPGLIGGFACRGGGLVGRRARLRRLR